MPHPKYGTDMTIDFRSSFCDGNTADRIFDYLNPYAFTGMRIKYKLSISGCKAVTADRTFQQNFFTDSAAIAICRIGIAASFKVINSFMAFRTGGKL
ncbi:MAG: hypothetical protein LKE64_13285 [Solobacterium sp.]|jgi:hypothetical protein|nr:hypothetical protein [Solobacterium sp.]MCH4048219.1 hypothetical protein [Solobacterium sp.]MCH4074927.1 hypothetical protein [Solobacterium sp.]